MSVHMPLPTVQVGPLWMSDPDSEPRGETILSPGCGSRGSAVSSRGRDGGCSDDPVRGSAAVEGEGILEDVWAWLEPVSGGRRSRDSRFCARLPDGCRRVETFACSSDLARFVKLCDLASAFVGIGTTMSISVVLIRGTFLLGSTPRFCTLVVTILSCSCAVRCGLFSRVTSMTSSCHS